ncbi:MAG: 16S rRNA processing protein RimM [Bacteroidetes bacterium]|nr:MAG: 16S rRNA processing protein RimM [Bacteroidota bacterium]
MSTSHPQWRTIPGFVRVGICGKTHGAAGEIKLRIDTGREEACLSSPFLFIDIDGSKVPFAIDGMRRTKDLLVSFAEVSDNTAASRFVGREVFLPSDEVDAEPVEVPSDLEFDYLTGMSLHANGEFIGQIEEVREFPQQEMAVVMYQNSEILIPLNETLIVSIDVEAKKIEMLLPDGLLSL